MSRGGLVRFHRRSIEIRDKRLLSRIWELYGKYLDQIRKNPEYDPVNPSEFLLMVLERGLGLVGKECGSSGTDSSDESR